MRRIVSLARWIVLFELSLYRSLLRWVTRRPDVPVADTPFAYAGAVSLLLWVFVGVSTVELVVLHLILPWETVRLIADIVGIWGVLWMLGLTASLHVHPHLVGTAGLRIRYGTDTVFVVPWDVIASVTTRERSVDSSRSVQLDRSGDGATLSVVVGSRTNVEVVLTRPVTYRVRRADEMVSVVRFFADNPKGLARCLSEHADTMGS